MKMRIILLILWVTIQLNAMEPEESESPSELMPSEELEKLMEEQEDIERLERYKRPWKEETPEEKAANREQQIAHLQSMAAFEQLPEELKVQIISFLVTAPGEDKEKQLRVAAQNIRAVLLQPNAAMKRLLNDENFNGYLIQQLAQQADDDIVAAAIALGTKAGGQWLKKHILNVREDLSARYHLKEAIEKSNFEIVKFLVNSLPANIILFKTSESQDNFLMLAARVNGNAAVVKLLIKAGIPINARNRYGGTALMMAAWQGDVQIVTTLLDAGAEIDLQDNEGSTALGKASEMGNIAVIKELIKRGAHLYSRLGKNPLHEAVLNDHPEVIPVLVELGFDLNEPTLGNHKTALMLSAIENSPNFFDALLEAQSICLDFQDLSKRTALHYIVIKDENIIGDIEEEIVFAKKLLEAGADPNIEDRYSKTPLDYAEELEVFDDEDESAKAELIQLLKSYGAKRGNES